MTMVDAERSQGDVDDIIPVQLGGGSHVYSEGALAHDDIIDQLQSPDMSKVSDVPPIKPKGGENYMIQCPTSQDWSCDQYQWVQKGRNKKEIQDDILVKTYFNIKVPGIKEGKGRTRPNSSSKLHEQGKR